MRRRGFVVALLLALFAQLALSGPRLSITSDEPSHVIAGLTYLRTGDLWAQPLHGHPPLLNLLCAAPLLLQPDLPDLVGFPGWGIDFLSYARAVLPRLGPIERLTFVTRLPVMLLTLLLAALVYRWAIELFGGWAGVLALALLVFDPNLLAHANLATTDLGVALCGLAALYAAWRAARAPLAAPRWVWIGVAGLSLGLTLAGKGSGFLYIPALVAVLVWPHRRLAGLRRLLVEGALLIGIAFVVLWAVYGFQIGALPGSNIIVPFPAHFGQWRILFQAVQRVAFLRGETRLGGWWWYFLYTTAVKTPLAFLAMGGWAIVLWLRRGPRHWMAVAPLLIFPALYWLTAITSGMNIGHRHLLPTFPFAYIFVAQLATLRLPALPARRRLARGALGALVALHAFSALSIFPFYLAYFNPLAGGPRQGYRHLVDSNVDWGQSFIALRDYMTTAHIPTLRLSYYTYADPAAYGLAYDPLPPVPGIPADALTPFAPQPAIYAISATPLQGVMVSPGDLYDWFRHRDPIAQPGYGLLVYTVQPDDVAVEWVAQCTTPVAPLPAEVIFAGVGAQPRLAAFDCAQSWLTPPGPGYHLLARRDDLLTQSFVAEQLAPLALAYEQRESGVYPAFAFYRSVGTPRAPVTASHVAPSAWPLAQALATAPLTAPLTTAGPLDFLGARFTPGPYRAGDTVELATFWRVAAIPDLRNLSVMGHLLSAEGALVANADGLGVPLDQWRAGDIITQRHAIVLPADTAPGRYWLQTGLYWLDTLERWPIADAGDRILMGEIRVRP